MKQKIVMKVSCNKCRSGGCDKCKRKALKIATDAQGVSSVSLEGADKDQVVVIGEQVDSVCLARTLRKKSYQADIIKVEEVKDKKDDKEKEKEKEKEALLRLLHCRGYCPPYPPSVIYEDPYWSNCIIM